MIYISLYFYVFVGGMVLLYYVLPKKFRWLVLLAGSIGFYYKISGKGFWVFLATLAAGYGLGIGLESGKREKEKKLTDGTKESGRDGKAKEGKKPGRWLLVVGIFLLAVPLVVTKNGDFVLKSLLHRKSYPWIVPVGMSFYTLQMISYLVDIFRGKIKAQRNLGKFALFVTFFPQVVQGPIPRYEQLGNQLYEGHPFEEKEFCKGLQLIVWGFFLKLMIADKASIVVNQVFDHWKAYQGCYVLVAGVLYSIQLYTDFLSCVCLSKGVAELFGIHLADNFRRPYLAESVKEFWGRWHISLSSWLRDYIYIPLGGNRKGRFRKYAHIFVVFTISGIWHGAGYKYLFWGWVHGIYQIGGDLTKGLQNKIYDCLHMEEGGKGRVWCRRLGTWFLVMIAWIIFRADSLREGIAMVYKMITVYNPWIFFDDSLLRLGLSWKEWGMLGISLWVLCKVEQTQEKEVLDVRDRILRQPLALQWGFYLAAVAFIMVFGTYGFGFNAADFIYGGF